MEWFAILVVGVVLWYGFRRLRGSGSGVAPRATKGSRELDIFNRNREWLEERWERADLEKSEGNLRIVRPWFFDDPTDRQLARIEDIGLTIRGTKLTKGQISDIIGLYEAVEPENAEILRFFKISFKGFNQSRARHEVARLMADPASSESWKNRPASTWQKEFFRAFECPIPRDLTHEVAEKIIAEKQRDLLESDKERLQEWEDYESIFDELSDPDTREDYELKKPSVKALREAVVSLLEEGREMRELSDDLQLVVDRLVERNPSLQRGST